MKIQTIIGNLKEYLENYSWGSTAGGVTSLQAVYTYPKWDGTDGYPYAVILDNQGVGRSLANNLIEFTTTIQISFCVNYSVIDKQTEEEQAEEAMMRLREIWDIWKVRLLDEDTTGFGGLLGDNDSGVDWLFDPSYIDEYDEEYNIYKRTCTLIIKETINR